MSSSFKCEVKKEKKNAIAYNVPEYAMFDSGIICPKGDRWQIWV